MEEVAEGARDREVRRDFERQARGRDLLKNRAFQCVSCFFLRMRMTHLCVVSEVREELVIKAVLPVSVRCVDEVGSRT